jgi:predicted nicotinamide N-methyase
MAADDEIPPIGDFFICRDYVTKTYDINGVSQDIDCLAAAATDFDLTGQVIWLVSIYTTYYLEHIKDRLRNQTVLELGAGAALCGLFASKYASTVVLSDFEDEVLKLIDRNLKHCPPTCRTLTFNLSWGSEDDHEKLRGELGLSKVPIIVGADIVYWSNSITPLVQSVSALLADDGEFILGYYNRVSPMRVSCPLATV